MKKLLFVVIMLFTALAHAGPTTPADIRWSQNLDIDPSNGTTTRYLSVPAAGTTCAAVLSGTTRQPACMLLGAGLTVVDNTISALTQAPADWTATTGVTRILNKPTFGAVAYSGDWADLINRPTTLAAAGITDAVTFTSLASTLSGYPTSDQLSSQLAGYATTASLSSYVTTSSLTAVGYITQAGARGAISLTTTGSGAATYSSSTGVLNIPTPAVPASRAYAYRTPSLNTCFQLSTTRDVHVNYAVDVTTTLTVGGGARGSVYLRTYTDSGCTTGQQTVVSGSSGLPATLSVAVGLQNLGSVALPAIIPAATWVRIETANDIGTPTFSARASQEVQL